MYHSEICPWRFCNYFFFYLFRHTWLWHWNLSTAASNSPVQCKYLTSIIWLLKLWLRIIFSSSELLLTNWVWAACVYWSWCLVMKCQVLILCYFFATYFFAGLNYSISSPQTWKCCIGFISRVCLFQFHTIFALPERWLKLHHDLISFRGIATLIWKYLNNHFILKW